MRRFELTDEPWKRVEGLLPGKAGDPGDTAKDTTRPAFRREAGRFMTC